MISSHKQKNFNRKAVRSRGGAGGGGGVVPPINPALLYAEREFWSPQGTLWRRYAVPRPRLPSEADRRIRWVDQVSQAPQSFSAFLGQQRRPQQEQEEGEQEEEGEEVGEEGGKKKKKEQDGGEGPFAQLQEWLEVFEDQQLLPDVIILAGPAGSGKSSIGRLFVQGLVDSQPEKEKGRPSAAAEEDPAGGYFPKARWIFSADGRQFPLPADLTRLLDRIHKYFKRPFPSTGSSSTSSAAAAGRVKFRLLVIDNFDALPPSSQQSLKNILQPFFLTQSIKCFFLCEKPKESIVSYFLSHAKIVHTKSLCQRDALVVILSLCHRNRIGYDREGIHMIFSQYLLPQGGGGSISINLSAIIDCCQKVFVEKFFLSEGNVIKAMGLTPPTPIISPSAAIQPYERCVICTLYPPCRHHSQEELNERGLMRRKELPRYPSGSMPCPEFLRYGHCSIFNKYGVCSLDHPKNVHRIEKVIRRCPQCTIPWPCNHCVYSTERQRLCVLIEDIHARLGRLRQIHIPDPPLFYVRQLESFPNWRERVAMIDERFVTSRSFDILQTVEQWVDNAYSINALAYSNRCKLLLETFGEVCTSEILNVKAFAMIAGKAGTEGGGGGGSAVGSLPTNEMDAVSVASSVTTAKSHGTDDSSVSRIQKNNKTNHVSFSGLLTTASSSSSVTSQSSSVTSSSLR
eukprot:gene4350-4772_t